MPTYSVTGIGLDPKMMPLPTTWEPMTVDPSGYPPFN